jgi:hypothetical protein
MEGTLRKSRLWLLALLLLFAGIASPQEQHRTLRIPFRDVHGRVILDAKLDGKPAALLLDTGAAMSFRLKPPRPLVLVVHHDEPQFETAEPDERCPTIAAPDVRVQGFVGTDILKRFRAVRIDQKNRVIELEEN